MSQPDSSAAGRRRTSAEIGRMSAEGLDLASFRTNGLRSLRSSMTIDAAFFATVDPTTLLFTSALAEEPLASVTAQFLDNEYGRDDVNKFARLAASADKVSSLDQATGGDRCLVARYREVLAPLGLGDEIRVALSVGGLCWGVLCLHRSASVKGFDAAELDLLRRVAPDLAKGLRRSFTLYPTATTVPAVGPGIIILNADLGDRLAESSGGDVTGRCCRRRLAGPPRTPRHHLRRGRRGGWPQTVTPRSRRNR